jgi:hypothetical protein
VRDTLFPRDVQIIANVWYDGYRREWQGPEVSRECRRIAAAAASALKDAELEDQP